ncbi:helical backbone metal receptor [Shewanella sp. 10N.286.52.B9]|uniref:helical backbone metal receptor n=1 Tax=Shewanella sp. 10N.286.52.B9 TaxID=1880837 RepID=UPI000C840F1C|nr:helical backbone metal receptor [Shewanella sp. 10N.286.52.B9]PMG51925.1 cobalamin-binding protein [Shewanella sp. 10N.286.52.B9]
MSIFVKPISLIVAGFLVCLTTSYAHSAQQRFVVLSPHAVEMMFSIDAGDRIIGTVEYADYPAAANDIKRIGRYDFVNYEALMMLNPDAIIVNSESTSSGMLSRIKSLGFTVIDTSVTELADIPKRLIELGQLTGQQQLGQQQAAQFSQQLNEIRQQYQHQDPISIFYQVWPHPLTTTSSSWMDEIFAGCGGVNIFENAHSDYPQVNMEQVVSLMPEMIFKPIYHGNSNQELIRWETWSELPAVKHGQVIALEGDLIHRTGPRVLQGMINICQKIDLARHQRAATL